MMRFFATQFSRSAGRLLMPSLAILLTTSGFASNELKTNNLDKEIAMTKQRSEIPLKDRWNVEALYPNEHAWKKDFETLQGSDQPRWPQLEAHKGRLRDPQAVASLLEIYMAIDRKLAKLHTYAHLRMDEDLGNDSFKSDYGLISGLIYDFQKECAWIEPELLGMEENDYRNLLSASSLEPYRFYLEKVNQK